MKKLLVVLFFLLSVPALAVANQVEIVEIKGKVSVRENATADWAKAAVGLRLERAAEIKTGFLGKCTLAFDPARQNTITINKSTHVAIEDVIPGSVFLSKGRVLTLIRNLEQVGDFEVRTPTAVTGARGTGWVTEFENGETLISVFEDNIFLQGIREDGHRTDRLDLREDFRTSVAKGGEIQETDIMPERERERLKDEFKHMEGFMHDPNLDGPPMGPDGMHHPDGPTMGPDGMYHPDGPMTVEQLIAELQMQQENGNISPEEEAMLNELYEVQNSISGLPPEEQDQILKDMGQEFGAYDPAMDDPNYDPTMGPGPDDPNAGNYTYDPQTGEYYDQEGNLMEGMAGQYYDPAMDPNYDPNYDPSMDPNYDPNMDPNYDPNMDPNAGSYTYDPETGNYYDGAGNYIPPEMVNNPDAGGEHFDNYMTGINGPGPDGQMGPDPYAGDYYFGDQGDWGHDGGYDPYDENKDDFHDAIHDENQEGYICPYPPPPCWFDYQVFCPGHIIPPPPECPNEWPPECNPAQVNACHT